MIFSIIFVCSLLFVGNSSQAMESFGQQKLLYDLAVMTALLEQEKTSLDTFIKNFAEIKALEQEFHTKLITNAPASELSTLEQRKLQLQKDAIPFCMPFLVSLKKLTDNTPGIHPELHKHIDDLLRTGKNILDNTSQVTT